MHKFAVSCSDYKQKTYSEYEKISDQIIDTGNNLLVEPDGVKNKDKKYHSKVYEVISFPKTVTYNVNKIEYDIWSINEMANLLGDNESDFESFWTSGAKTEKTLVWQ